MAPTHKYVCHFMLVLADDAFPKKKIGCLLGGKVRDLTHYPVESGPLKPIFSVGNARCL